LVAGRLRKPAPLLTEIALSYGGRPAMMGATLRSKRSRAINYFCMANVPVELLTQNEFMEWKLRGCESGAERDERTLGVAFGAFDIIRRRSVGESLPDLTTLRASQGNVHAGDKLI
jgi:hypothetical protein